MINYVFPEEDPRGNVMLALSCAYYNLPFDIDDVLEKAEENKINLDEVSGIGFLGENSSVELKFIKTGKNWFDLGCRYYVKRIG